MVGLSLSYSVENVILSSSYVVGFFAYSSKQHPIRMTLIGTTKIKTEMQTATILGMMALSGIPSGMKLDQVKLPKLKMKGPK